MSLTVRGPGLSAAALRVSSASFDRSAARLSSGLRIASAADDAAGLVLSERLRSQVTGSAVAARNVHDGINLLQTAEGGLSAITSMLQRARDLAVQAASTGAMTAADREIAAAEVRQLVDEIDRVSATTQYNRQGLLDGARPGGWAFQVGAASGDTLVVHLPDRDAGALGLRGSSGMTATSTTTTTYSTKSATIADGYDPSQDGGEFTFSVGGGPAVTVQLTSHEAYESDELGQLALDLQAALPTGLGVTVELKNKKLTFSSGDPTVAVNVTGSGATALGITTEATSTVSLSSTAFSTADLVELVRAGSGEAMTVVDTALGLVTGTRTYVGATQNRLEHRLSVLATTADNLASARSRITDADVATEWMAVVRAQLLTQTGMAVQAQAVAGGQRLLQLLGQAPDRAA